MKLYSRLGSEN